MPARLPCLFALGLALLACGCREEPPAQGPPATPSTTEFHVPHAAPPAATSAAPKPEARLGGSVDLVLEEVSGNKQDLIKFLFVEAELSMPAARAAVDEPPVTILSAVSRGKAAFLKEKLEALGAKATIKE